MRFSDKVLEAIKGFEGLRLETYEDPAGVLTVGYGHTGENVRPGDRISKYWAEELLKTDLMKVCDQLDELELKLTQGQADALISFTFNLGIGRLKSSTLLKVIRGGGSMRQIRREFMRWTHAGGKSLKGLERRRKWEADRFFENDEMNEQLRNI